jgi:hypothetical protein
MAPKTSLPNFFPDRVVPAASADPVELWIFSVFPKDGWLPHSAGDLTRVEYPGSAIKYGEKIYELMRAEETVEGGYRFRYGLRAWEPQNAIRHLVSYTLEEQVADATAHLETIRTQQLRHRILWLFPFAGFAPDPLQREWERRTGLSMAWASFGSALVGLMLAFLLRGASQDIRFEVAVLYLALESFARLFWIGVTHQPHGTPLLTAPYLLWQAIRRTPPAIPKEEIAADLSLRQDEVLRGLGENPLRIRSRYFDTDLTGPAPVSVEGTIYRPVRMHQEGKGLARCWVYELEMVASEPGRRTHEYTNPRAPDRQRAVEEFTRRLDLAQSFALFWGIYPRRDQVRLQLLYQYDGPHSTAVTAGIFLALGLVQLSLDAPLYHVTILAFAGPAYLILESAYRLYQAKALGRPAGSVVGYVLRVVIRPPK